MYNINQNKKKNDLIKQPVLLKNITNLTDLKNTMRKHNIDNIDDLNKLILEEEEEKNKIVLVDVLIYTEAITKAEIDKIKKYCQCSFCVIPWYSVPYLLIKGKIPCICCVGCLKQDYYAQLYVVEKTRNYIIEKMIKP